MKNDQIHNKLQYCISQMVTGEILPYYGEFNLFVNFKQNDDIKTCGVNVSKDGMNFYWNKKFLESLPQKQVNFVLIHETFHLLFKHYERSVNYKHNISNLAQDMIINKIILDDIINTDNRLVKGFIELPIINNEKLDIFPPIEYKGNLVFEELYHWLYNEEEKYNNGDGVSNYLSGVFDDDNNGEFLDIHMIDEINNEYKTQIISDVKNTLKNRGFISSDINSTLNKLIKQKKDHLRYIKRYIINYIFGENKYSSILRPNRRDIEGLKGYVKKGKHINCILDTSGSMSDEINKVLSFVFQNNIRLNLIQIDTKIKSVDVIKNMKQLEKLNIVGKGGTKLTPSLEYIANNNKLNKLTTLILTDGMTDVLDFNGVKNRVLIISTHIEPEIINHKNIKIIVIDK